jgi:hypothetical protein
VDLGGLRLPIGAVVRIPVQEGRAWRIEPRSTNVQLSFVEGASVILFQAFSGASLISKHS